MVSCLLLRLDTLKTKSNEDYSHKEERLRHDGRRDVEMKHDGVVYRYILKAPGIEHGWSYIGETLDLPNRRRYWKNPSGQHYAGGKIGAARNKYGVTDDVWDFEILEQIPGYDRAALKQILQEREEHYIALYDSVVNGFNISCGGTGNKGVNFSPQHRANIGKASKGRRHTDDTKQRISAKLKGRTIPQEVRDKISAGNKGKKRTPAQCLAASLRMQGKSMSPAARAKSSATKKGKPHPISPEGMANINAHRYKIGIWAIDKNGNQLGFNSLSEAAEHFNQSVAAVSHLLKTGNYGKHGFRLVKKT